MCNMATWRSTDIPITEVSHPTNEHGWLTDGDSNMMPLWFDGNLKPKLLIDTDDLSNSEASDNEYRMDFVINAK